METAVAPRQDVAAERVSMFAFPLAMAMLPSARWYFLQ
jgi:hypothetical protein